mgnify:CR=1 FL=1
MDISSSSVYPIGDLSNFTERHFIFDDIVCNSLEGVLQSLKMESVDEQKKTCLLVSYEAKKRGRKYSDDIDWRKSQTLFWKGVEYNRKSKEYQLLLDRLYDAVYIQCPEFSKALVDAGKNTKFTHSIGCTNIKETILTEYEFCSRLQYLKDYGLLKDKKQKVSYI